MNIPSSAFYEAEKALGKAKIALSRAEGFTDLSKNVEYQTAVEEAHRLIGRAIQYVTPVMPLVRRMGDTLRVIEAEVERIEKNAQQAASAQGQDQGVA